MCIKHHNLHNCAELTSFVDEIGFLPLLRMGITGWSAEEQVSEECAYAKLPDGGWEWPLWEWKGPVIQDSGCAYGKFFLGKAGFVSKVLWPDFCNWRRNRCQSITDDSIEAMILDTLKEHGSLITRDLRAACGFTGAKMRSRFDSYVTRLEMGCRIVTEDFVYPRDKHGRQYGWGWSLLTTPEILLGRDACRQDCTPEESFSRLKTHFNKILPGISDVTIRHLLGGCPCSSPALTRR